MKTIYVILAQRKAQRIQTNADNHEVVAACFDLAAAVDIRDAQPYGGVVVETEILEGADEEGPDDRKTRGQQEDTDGGGRAKAEEGKG